MESGVVVRDIGSREQDLHLIDVLYRQDFDMGVGKEMYDIQLRKQKEKECELELERTRAKQKELEAYRQKLEEEQKLREQEWLEQHYTRDGETGEWIPVSIDVPQLPTAADCNGNELQDLEISEVLDAALDLLENQTQEEGGEVTYNTTQFPSNPGPAGANVSNYGDVFTPSFSLPNTTANFTAAEATPASYMAPSGFSLPASTPSSTLPPSLEENWNDLLQFINSSGEEAMNTTAIDSASIASLGPMTPPTSSFSALIQNASMPTPVPDPSITDHLGLNSSGLMPLSLEGNATLPDSGNTSPLEWEMSEFAMPNLTELSSQTDMLLPDQALEEALKETADLDAPEEASNDSAVSLGSTSPAQQDMSDLAAGCVSPYDGLEGATGGSDYDSTTSPSYSKMSKYDPDEFQYGSSFFSYSQSESSHTNFSSSNDSSNMGPSSSLSPLSAASPNHHVHHNHTYTVAPGATPKEVKAYREKPKHKGPQSRDEKRAQEMNVPLTMSEMIETPVEEFNEIVSRHKLTEGQLQLIRDIRRRGKNKIAAQNCRRRKLDVIVNMEDDLGSLQKMRDDLAAEQAKINAQMREMKEKYSSLYGKVFHSLRDEHGNRYNPEEYSLQQATDGNIFLVPRNGPQRSNRDKDEPMGSRKRKKMEK